MRTNGNDTRSARVLAEEFDGQVVSQYYISLDQTDLVSYNLTLHVSYLTLLGENLLTCMAYTVLTD